MAITIEEAPQEFCAVGQKIIIVASSTNVNEDGFRYHIDVGSDSGDNIQLNIPPNPNNKLVVDLSSLFKKWLKIEPAPGNNPTLSYLSCDSQLLVTNDSVYDVLKKITVLELYEAYIVDGVFTIDEETRTDVFEDLSMTIFKGSYKVIDGYRPDPNLRYSFTGTTSKLLGGRTPNTHIPLNYPIGSATTSNQIIWIPVRRSELDFGCLSFILQYESDWHLQTTENPYIRMVIYNSSGAPTTQSVQVNGYEQSLISAHAQVYPANLNAHGELLRPSDFPNWRWYDIALYDSTNTTRKSCIYRFYPIEDDCRFDNVRLAWWHPEIGGFDFFNFSKKNEESIEVDRKRVKKVVGTYNASIFSFNTYDRELAEGMVNRVDYINITTDWIQEGEFELLKSLIASQAVWIIKDDGSTIPVLVEENSYTARKIREAKQYNYSMKLRFSQQFM
jgi:hypothetical protein